MQSFSKVILFLFHYFKGKLHFSFKKESKSALFGKILNKIPKFYYRVLLQFKALLHKVHDFTIHIAYLGYKTSKSSKLRPQHTMAFSSSFSLACSVAFLPAKTYNHQYHDSNTTFVQFVSNLSH